MQSLAQSGGAAGRDETLARLAHERFDVLAIGGGIVGAGTAALAARHGLRVALLERADFASGSSSASSKLIHGGLRYLRMGDFRLVREALHEGTVLKRTVAPQLVHDLDFVLPVYHGGPYGRGAIGAALALYSLLGGHARGRGRFVPAARAQALVPALNGAGLRGVGLYADAQTNDARLCLANVRSAADAGAAAANRVEVVGIERRGDETRVAARDLRTGAALEVAARTVVNASGAAVDEVRRLEDPQAGASVSLSKGAHLVLERPPGWRAALTIPIDRERVSFAIPWEGLLLLGTTDSAFDPERDTLAVTAGEEAQILAEAGRVLPPEVLRPEAIRARFAGLRVLPLTAGATAEARREVVLTRGPLGVVSVAGGKLTTYRAIAISVLRELRADLGLREVDRTPFPLPGAADPRPVAAGLRRDFPALEPERAQHLACAYGSLAAEVLASGSLEPLAPGALDVEAQAVYALEREWALDADDVLRRRTTLALRGLDTPELRERLARLADERIQA
ncbi:MAG TPA: glycerol-3-phosphate dehydrogenase/oxidase [Gaiellaceae bacterium]|nr:glycerol-3-phosphate dehydrogenase/oxidase [Gaiellaceae bacterium]